MTQLIPEKLRSKQHKPYLGLVHQLEVNKLDVLYLACLLDRTPETIYRKIFGTSDFTYSEVNAICDALNCSASDFFASDVTQSEFTDKV